MISKIVILGAGKSGVGAAILGKKKGYDVFVSDKKDIDENLKDFLNRQGIQWEAGKHSIEAMKSADFIILDNDLITSPEVRIPLTNIVATFIDGELVFNRRYN